VYVANTKSYTSLTIDDSADATPRNTTLANQYLVGLTPGDIRWVETDVNSLVISGPTVNAGAAGNTYNVIAAPRLNSLPAQTVLNTGSGTVGDTVTVRSVTKSALVINGQNGPDTVTVGDNGSVQAIKGRVTVTNTNGRTALTVDDSADPGARNTVILDATSLTGLAPAVFELKPVSINWVERDLSSLTINGGTGGNTFTVNNTPQNDFPVTTSLFTGGGQDTVNVNAAKGPLMINGQAGDDQIRFFNFADSAFVDGGPGNNTIEVAQGALSASQVPFTNVQNLAVTGGSTLNVNADVTPGTILVQQGTLALQGGVPTVSNRVDIQAQGILTGTGTINGSLLNAGQILPAGACAVGRITVTDDYTQAATGSLTLDLQGQQPGTQSDNLEVGHDVQLDGQLNLNALAGFNGNLFELVTNRGPDAVNGIFAGLPEGTAVKVAGQQFQISYHGGDGNDVVLHQVAQVGTATTVDSSVNPSVFGQLVTFTATVSALGPAPVPPSGTVTFLDGGTILGTGTLFVVGGADQATFSTAALIVGSHPITAVYAGDSTFIGSASPVVTQVVNQANTDTVVVSAAGSVVYGQSVIFTAGSGTPTGTVQFQVDGTSFGTPVALTAGQAASASLSTFAAGPHTISAIYSGDSSFLTSTGTYTQTVTPAPLTITADDQSTVYGAALPSLTASYSGFVNGDTAASLATPPTLTTTATASSPVGSYAITASGAVDANYTISYVAGTLSITPAPLTITADDQSMIYAAALPPLTASYSGFVNGDTAASLTTPPTLTTTATAGSPVGSYAISADGAVDPNYAISYVDGTLTANQAGTSTTISADNATTVFGQPITFTAAVVALPPGGTPTGTVVFEALSPDGTGAVTLGTGTLDATGTAVFVMDYFVRSTQTVFAVYQGDSNFGPSTSATITQVIDPADTTLALSSGTPVSVAGQTVDFTTGQGVVAPGSFVVPATGTITFYDTFQGSTTGLTAIDISGSPGVSPALTAAGTHVITAVYSGDSDFNGSTSAAIAQTVNPGPATHFSVSTAAGTTAGVAVSVTVTALDDFNNTATDYQGTVHLRSTDGQAVLPADHTFAAADNGVQTFSITLKTAASQDLTVGDTVTGTIRGTATIQVVAAAASQLLLVPAQGTVSPGVPFAMTVIAIDPFGNTDTNYQGTVHFTSSDPQAGVPADSTFTAADHGVLTVGGFVLRSPGDQTFTVTDTLTPSITGTVYFRFNS
jgi:hypothetical protein